MSTKMTDTDWASALEVFRACLPRRGRKAGDDRLFSEAMHFFAVENVRWRALPERFGQWNSVWERFDRLSKAGVFEAFFDTLAEMRTSAHLIQMFDPPLSAPTSRPPAQRGAARPGARPFARRVHDENLRQSGQFRRHHRVRSDRRPGFGHSPLRDLARHRARHHATRRAGRQRLFQQGHRAAARTRGIAPGDPS